MNRPSVKGDEILKTDPGSLARQSISMIYTPKPTREPEPPRTAESMKKKTPAPSTASKRTSIRSTPSIKEPTPLPVPSTPAPSTPSVPSPTPTPVLKPPPAPPPPPPAPKPVVRDFRALRKARPPPPKSEFDPLLQCPMCRKRIIEPKIVCCRRLCQTCLQDEIEETAGDSGMQCKECGSTIIVPEPAMPRRSWAQQFQTDPFLAHLREAVMQLEGRKLCYVCGSRNRTTEAVNYCFDCDTNFCNSCTEAHCHMPAQKKHRVKSLSQVTPTDIMKMKKRFCKSHEGVVLDLYCLDHQVVMCQECASTVHKSCGAISTVANVATDKREKLRSAEKVLEVGISKCQHNTKRIQIESAEIDQLKQQTMDEIDGSFSQVIRALENRKTKLKQDIDDHFKSETPHFEDNKKTYDTLMKSMKSKMDFVMQMVQHASDFDILLCADNILTSAETMASQNKTVVETPKPKVVVKIDDTAVRNFVELVALLGAEVGSTQIKGILLKKITTKMKGDQHTPDIRDILLAADSHIVAVDNKNMCVKSIQIDGENFITKRLELKSEPWGGTKLQPSMIAVTGLKVIYIITITDQIALQSTVKTRKDYWGICSISPINLVCTCKYPPGVDIVDITGRRLRSIDEDQMGEQLFEMPGYVAMNGDLILVTDRAKRSLTCIDQEGKVIFIYRGQGEEKLLFPRGICVDKQGRIFVADHDKGCVHLISRHGEYLCQVMNVSKPRTMCLDHNDRTLYLSNEGKGLTFFNLIEVQT